MRSLSRAGIGALVAVVLLGLLVGGVGAASAAKPVVKRPTVTGLDVRSGPVAGGTRVVASGTGFRKVRSVTVSGVRATSVRVLSPRRLSFVTPAGLAGPSAVRVTNKAGTSSPTSRSRFTYREPADEQSASYDPEVTPTAPGEIVWVTGGTDIEAPVTGEPEPWVVGFRGEFTQSVGDSFFLAPGSAVFPVGLAGTVGAISTQADGITAVTVTPTPLDQVFSSGDVAYTGPLEDDSSARRGSAADGGIVFPTAQQSAFRCTRPNSDQEVALRGGLQLSLDNIRTHFEVGLGARPSLNAWVRFEPVVTGRLTGSAAASCRLKPEWQNARRRVFPLGPTGATVSIAPILRFTVSASGTIEVQQRSSRMVGLTLRDGRWRPIDVRRTGPVTVSASAARFTAGFDAGVSVQFGLLDRVGIEGRGLLAATGEVSVRTNPSRACVDLSIAAKLEVVAYVDVWFARVESPSLEHSFPFLSARPCLTPVRAVEPETGPSITTTRLAAATNGSAYEGRLQTADGRSGTWSAGPGLPAGLSLDAEGHVTGTPSAAVRDHTFAARFVDASGRSDSQAVRIYVKPPDLVGGGSFQATLSWSHAADLDLHVIEPNGDHLSYENTSSDSGGELDRDANVGCGDDSAVVENVFWPQGAAPSGTYRVYPDLYSECDVADPTWHLVVRVDGRVVLDERGSGSSDGFEVVVGQSGRVTARPSRTAPASGPGAPKAAD